MLPLASLTEPIVNFATNVIGDLGTAGIFLLMLLDSACIPTSSEAIMLFAGFKVADGRFTLLAVDAVHGFGDDLYLQIKLWDRAVRELASEGLYDESE